MTALGRPVKYETPEDMQVAIDKYFKEIDEHNKEFPLERIPYTVTGLAMALDMTRRTLLDYCEKSDAFSHTIKKAKLKVEEFNERQLYRNTQVTGVIFNLKNNFGWEDAQKIDGSLSYFEKRALEEKNGEDRE